MPDTVRHLSDMDLSDGAASGSNAPLRIPFAGSLRVLPTITDIEN